MAPQQRSDLSSPEQVVFSGELDGDRRCPRETMGAAGADTKGPDDELFRAGRVETVSAAVVATDAAGDEPMMRSEMAAAEEGGREG
jgi:hypothetical protein